MIRTFFEILPMLVAAGLIGAWIADVLGMFKR